MKTTTSARVIATAATALLMSLMMTEIQCEPRETMTVDMNKMSTFTFRADRMTLARNDDGSKPARPEMTCIGDDGICDEYASDLPTIAVCDSGLNSVLTLSTRVYRRDVVCRMDDGENISLEWAYVECDPYDFDNPDSVDVIAGSCVLGYKIKKYSSSRICREANGSCEADVYCTGTNETCPRDLTKESDDVLSEKDGCVGELTHRSTALDVLICGAVQFFHAISSDDVRVVRELIATIITCYFISACISWTLMTCINVEEQLTTENRLSRINLCERIHNIAYLVVVVMSIKYIPGHTGPLLGIGFLFSPTIISLVNRSVYGRYRRLESERARNSDNDDADRPSRPEDEVSEPHEHVHSNSDEHVGSPTVSVSGNLSHSSPT